MHMTVVGLTCIRSVAVGIQQDFQSLIPDRAVFENVPSFIIHPRSAWTILFGGVWRKPLEILPRGGESLCHGVASRVSFS